MPEQTNVDQIACSLDGEQLRDRQKMVRTTLLSHLVEAEKFGSGLRLTFPESDTLRSSVETFVGLERQCCGSLSFTVTPPDKGLTLTIEGPPEAQATLDMFAAHVCGSGCTSVINTQPDSNKQSAEGKGVRRTGIAGIAFGLMALLACELPIILALIGLGGLSTAAVVFRPPFVVEVTGIVIGVTGALMLIGLGFRRLWLRKRRATS